MCVAWAKSINVDGLSYRRAESLKITSCTERACRAWGRLISSRSCITCEFKIFFHSFLKLVLHRFLESPNLHVDSTPRRRFTAMQCFKRLTLKQRVSVQVSSTANSSDVRCQTFWLLSYGCTLRTNLHRELNRTSPAATARQTCAISASATLNFERARGAAQFCNEPCATSPSVVAAKLVMCR